MARRRAKQTDGEKPQKHSAGHNAGVEVRASIQLTAFGKLWDCDRDIADAKAQHIKPLQEERLEIWKTLRNDLDAQAADLRPLYALYKRDREVKAFDDFDLCQKSQDMLREGWETLAAGKTLNFLEVLGGDAKGAGANGSEPEHISTKTARAAGREAGRAGKNADHNPHAADSEAGAAWEAGRGEGMIDNAPGGGDPFGPKGEATAH